MADHEHGSMDIEVQEKAFDGFIRYSTYGVGVSIAVIVFALILFG